MQGSPLPNISIWIRYSTPTDSRTVDVDGTRIDDSRRLDTVVVLTWSNVQQCCESVTLPDYCKRRDGFLEEQDPEIIILY